MKCFWISISKHQNISSRGILGTNFRAPVLRNLIYLGNVLTKHRRCLVDFFIWWSTAYHRSIAHQNEKKDYPLLFCTNCGSNCFNPDIFFECFLQFNFLSFAFLSRIIYILMRTTYKSIFSWYWYLFRCIDVLYILFLTGSFVLLYNQLV